MAIYNYRCTNDCKHDDLEKHKGDIVEDIQIVKGGDLVWEVKHGMLEDPEIKCPLCGGAAEKTYQGTPTPVSYIRGNGYLDKAGCKRDMDLFKLENNEDPYAGMRQPGEVDHIKDKLRRGGKHNPNRKHYTT